MTYNRFLGREEDPSRPWVAPERILVIQFDLTTRRRVLHAHPVAEWDWVLANRAYNESRARRAGQAA